MKVKGLMMVTVQVRDFDGVVAWYRDVLGLDVQWFEPGEFCTLRSPGSEGLAFALATDHPERVSAEPGKGWTPTLAVEDFDRVVAELRGRGIVFDAEEEGTGEGYRLVRIRDPEGNAIGITPQS